MEILLLTGSAAYASWRLRHHWQGLRERCAALVVLTAVGDAKGIPYENLTREQIQQRQRGAGLYDRSTGNPYIPEGYGEGHTTDDTQLTLAMVAALHAAGRLDMEEVSRQHVAAWRRTVVGWGGSRDAIARIAGGTAVWRTAGNPRATGNGVIMKLAPLALYYASLPLGPGADPHRVLALGDAHRAEVEALCFLTHRTPVCFVTATLYAAMAEDLFRRPNQLDTVAGRAAWLHRLVNLCEQLERRYLSPEFLASIGHALSADEDAEAYAITVAPVSPLLSGLLAQLAYLSNDDLVVSLTKGGTFYCASSLSMVVALLARSPPRFKTVIEAALIGGDTDSNAAMVGALLGGMKGADLDTADMRAHVTGLADPEPLAVGAAQLYEICARARLR